MLSIVLGVFEAFLKLFSSTSATSTVVGAVEAVAAPVTSQVKLFLKLGLIVAVLAAIGGTWWYIDDLQSELALAKSNAAVLVSANKQQKDALTLCTKNTEALKADSDKLAADAAKVQAAAEPKAQAHYDKAKEIMARKPKPGQSDLDAINDIFNSLIPNKVTK